MLKRFSRPFAYLLLLLIPLQGIAAANMLVCNSMMQLQQAQASQHIQQAQQTQTMPCHAHLKSVQADLSADSSTHTDHGKTNQSKSLHPAPCKSVCASVCAMTALPTNAKPAMLSAASALVSVAHSPYVSITLPSLQRPPIFLA